MSGDSRAPVLFLGFDAAEPQLVQAGIDEGWLPTMARLVKGGRCVRLSPMPSQFYNASWICTITGTDVADNHGVLDRQLEPGTYRIVDVRASAVHRPPFWQYLSDAGLRSTVASIYGAPVLESFRGVQVQGWGTIDPYSAKFGKALIDPPDVEEWLRQAVGRRHLGHAVTAPRTPSQYRRYRDRMLRSVDEQTRGLSMLMDRTEWEFFFASFAESHQAGHLLWHLEDATHPGHDPRASEDMRGALRAIYRAIDSGFDQLLARAPDGCRVFVVNPHGMGPNYVHNPMEPILERGGWLTRRSRAAWKEKRREWLMRTAWSTARRVVPMRLRLAVRTRLPQNRIPAEMALAHVDWSATRAFALPSDSTSYVRINLAGREPEGIVQPGVEYDRLLDEISKTVGELVLADSGLPAVERVVRCDEEFGRPVEGALPDLCVIWANNGPICRLSSPKLGTFDVPFDDPRTGQHRHTGFMVGTGPGITPAAGSLLEGSTASLLDIAPTALALLDVEAPPILPGRPIPAFLGAASATSFGSGDHAQVLAPQDTP